MKQIIIFCLLLTSVAVRGQYNPSTATVTNKPLGIAQAVPTDARSYYYDASLFIWRPYQSTAEALSYLNLTKYRTGQFPIFINEGGSLQSNGSFVGGTIKEYVFKNGTANSNLVLKTYSAKGSIDQLRASVGDYDNYISTEKGKEGIFIIDTSDHTSADNGGTVIVKPDGTRLKRPYSGPVDVRWFGALPDGITDCSTAVQTMINLGIQSIFFPSVPNAPGYLINNTVTVTSGVTISGDKFGTPIITDINDHRPVFTTNGSYGSRHVIKDLHIIGHNGKKDFIGIWNKTPRFTYENILIERCGLGFKFDNTWLGSLNELTVFNADTGWVAIQLNGVDVKIDLEICRMNFYLTNSIGVQFQSNVNEGNDGLNPTPAIIDNSTNISGSLYFEGGYNYPCSHLVIGPTGYVTGLQLNISAVGAGLGQYPIVIDKVNQGDFRGYIGVGDSSKTVFKTTSNNIGVYTHISHSGYNSSTFTDDGGTMGLRYNYFPNSQLIPFNGWTSVNAPSCLISYDSVNVRKPGKTTIKLSALPDITNGNGYMSVNVTSPYVEKLRNKKITMYAWVKIPNSTEFSGQPYRAGTPNVYASMSATNGSTSVFGTSKESTRYIKGSWNLTSSTLTVPGDAASVSFRINFFIAGYATTGNEYINISEIYAIDDSDENVVINGAFVNHPSAITNVAGRLMQHWTRTPFDANQLYNIGDIIWNDTVNTANPFMGWVDTLAGTGQTSRWTTFGSLGSSIKNTPVLQHQAQFALDSTIKLFTQNASLQWWENNQQTDNRRVISYLDTTAKALVWNSTYSNLPAYGYRYDFGNVTLGRLYSNGHYFIGANPVDNGNWLEVGGNSRINGTFTTTGIDNYSTNINGSLTSLSKVTKGFTDSLYQKISDTTGMLTPYLRSGNISWPGTIYSSPTIGSISGHGITYSPTLSSQSAYTVFGNHTSGSATPTFGQLPVRTISATGSSYDGTKALYDDGTWKTPAGGSGNMAIGGAITGASAGSMLYVGTNGLLQQASNTRGAFFDSTSNGLRHYADGTHYVTYGTDASGNGSISSTGGTTYTINPSLTLNSSFNVGSSAGTGNLFVSSTAVGSSVSQVQIGGATNTAARIFERGSTNIVLATAGQSYANHIIGQQAVTEASSGTHPVIAGMAVLAPAITNGTGATGIASSLFIDNAPSGVTGTTGNYSVYAGTGLSHFGGSVEGNAATASNQFITRQQSSDSLANYKQKDDSATNNSSYAPIGQVQKRIDSLGSILSGRILTGLAVLDFPNTNFGSSSDLTISVTGAILSDPVSLGIPNGSITTTAKYTAWVSATNTVTVRFIPNTTEDPPSGTFKVAIFH